jgi:histidine triad (HIT) family protein
MTDCIFCKIVAGDIPSYKVYEDDQVLAFLDLTQTTKGHTLVVPKTHVRNVLDMTPDQASQLFSRVPEIARQLVDKLGAKGMNILQNNEEIAGQSVFHAHVHLIPRYSDEDTFDIKFSENKVDFDALLEVLNG